MSKVFSNSMSIFEYYTDWAIHNYEFLHYITIERAWSNAL